MVSKRRRLAQRRKVMGYTQEQLAEELGVDRTTVARWEAGETEPHAWQRPNLADALQLSAEQLNDVLADAYGAGAVSGELVALLPAETEETDGHLATLIESPLAILERIRQQSADHVTDALLNTLDLYVTDVVERYEAQGPAVLAPDVVRQRRWVHQLLVTCPPSKRGERVVKVAGRLSAQLAYMAVNLGRFRSARAYGIEAFELADQVDDGELKAWVRGTQSLTEYYAGHYDRALELAKDGRRYAGSGPQAVRLIINGEARALGKLNQPVDEAVDRAYELLTTFPPEPGMTPCISFGLYSEARVASNAATAYLALAKTSQVLEHANRAFQVVDTSPSTWSRALVRLDAASALAQGEHPDLERAVSLCLEAMAVSHHHRIESIKQRTRDFIRQLQPSSDIALVADFVAEAQAWLSEGYATE
ncbi:MAG TPA: helix-turn-helix domain-containing protein [Planosporangium sp.]|nr:helix-turn-helix domain-containing protein [Planosporangium sp.]